MAARGAGAAAPGTRPVIRRAGAPQTHTAPLFGLRLCTRLHPTRRGRRHKQRCCADLHTGLLRMQQKAEVKAVNARRPQLAVDS